MSSQGETDRGQIHSYRGELVEVSDMYSVAGVTRVNLSRLGEAGVEAGGLRSRSKEMPLSES